MHTYNQCPVCLSTDFKEVLRAKDHTVSKKDFSIHHCNNCTFRFTNPVPTQDEIGPYYQSEEYISHSNTSKGLINKAYQIVRKRTLKQKRKIIQNFTGKRSGNLLDIGAGTGAFLNTIQTAGWQVTGIEPDENARENAESLWGLKLRPAEEFFQLETGKYDAVTMWHVLEHVHELEAYLDHIFNLLNDQGKFIVAVPNYTSWDSGKYQEMWAAYDVPRHLYHFSPASLQHIVERKGFKLVDMKRMPFDSFYVSMLSEKYKDGSMIRGVWNGFCSWISSWSQKSRCSSLIYLIEKVNRQ